MDTPHTLLGRLAHALRGGRRRVRSTDWWMVAVEIAIVVLGILIAFQLDRWGDRLQSRQDEAQLMRQIADEARSSSQALTHFERQHRESAQNFRMLADAIDDPAAARAYGSSGRDGCSLLRLPAVQRAASGAIAQAVGPRAQLVRDPRLRELLRSAVANREFADLQLQYFRALFLEYGKTIEPHMRWRFTGPSTATACTVDIAELAGDARAVALLPKLARDHMRFVEYRAQERAPLDAIATRARCLADGAC